VPCPGSKPETEYEILLHGCHILSDCVDGKPVIAIVDAFDRPDPEDMSSSSNESAPQSECSFSIRPHRTTATLSTFRGAITYLAADNEHQNGMLLVLLKNAVLNASKKVKSVHTNNRLLFARCFYEEPHKPFCAGNIQSLLTKSCSNSTTYA
jgi:hypothetical protein